MDYSACVNAWKKTSHKVRVIDKIWKAATEVMDLRDCPFSILLKVRKSNVSAETGLASG